MRPITSKGRKAQLELDLEKLQEPDRAKIYVDARGRRWRYCDVTWFAGWQVGPEWALRTWENARREFVHDFPLRETALGEVPATNSTLSVVARALQKSMSSIEQTA